jgi:hypothetical protein
MAWTDYFVNSIPGAKVVASADAKPFVSHEIALREYVEIELNIQNETLPFHIFFRRFDAIGGELENRLFAQMGEKTLALKSAKELTAMRLNSMEFVLDGE